MNEVVFDFIRPSDFIAAENGRQNSPVVTRLGANSH